MKLPDACGSQLFPRGRKLPHLRALKINGTGWKAPPPYGTYVRSCASQPIGGSADIYSLIECCPNLVELDLAGAVQQGESLSCLSHLAHLTALTVAGPTMDNSCAAAVAAVTGLEMLAVIDPAPYNHKAADRATRRQQGGGWRGMHQSSATHEDQGGIFDFKGLRSLMKLKRVTTFTINHGSFIFDCLSVYSSDYGSDHDSDYGYCKEELPEFEGVTVRHFTSPVSWYKLAEYTLLHGVVKL
jgi:hypothetical protein